MISNHQNREQGLEVDTFLGHKPVRQSVSLKGFDYLECTDCHEFHELGKGLDVSEWKFSLMGLRPGLLKCAKGVCPRCQEMRSTFKGILEREE